MAEAPKRVCKRSALVCSYVGEMFPHRFPCRVSECQLKRRLPSKWVPRVPLLVANGFKVELKREGFLAFVIGICFHVFWFGLGWFNVGRVSRPIRLGERVGAMGVGWLRWTSGCQLQQTRE